MTCRKLSLDLYTSLVCASISKSSDFTNWKFISHEKWGLFESSFDKKLLGVDLICISWGTFTEQCQNFFFSKYDHFFQTTFPCACDQKPTFSSLAKSSEKKKKVLSIIGLKEIKASLSQNMKLTHMHIKNKRFCREVWCWKREAISEKKESILFDSKESREFLLWVCWTISCSA